MGKVVLYFLIIVTAVSLFHAPWITGLAYVANSLLQPQYIWNWVFYNIPIFKITAVFAILGLIFAFSQKKASPEIYKNKQNFLIFFIWLWMHCSHFLSPYKGAAASVSPEVVLGTINSIVIMYFVLVPLCQPEKALKYLCYVFIGVGLYYVYWANYAYFNQEWHRFFNNRLVGPYNSPYRDANVLSTLLVMALPFMILLFFRLNSSMLKFGIITLVPLTWHAMILFSSRAALLASFTALLLIAYIIRSKKANIVIGTAFVFFLVYQGSLLLERATETIDRVQVQTEEPINPRLVSWEVGLRLIPEYPIFGVGVQMFEASARSHFPGMTPHVAHNTFLNFSANSGLPAGLAFLALVYISFRRLLEVRHMAHRLDDVNIYALTASSISIFGFFVCSMFLDLIIFEPFYIVLIINLISYVNAKELLLNNPRRL